MNQSINKWGVLILTGIVTIASVFFIFRLSINSDIESYLPDHISSKMNNDSIESIFGIKEPILLVFESDDILKSESLEWIQNINNELTGSDAFDRVISIFETKLIEGKDGMMIVENLIDNIPETETERNALRKKIQSNENIYRQLISENFTTTMILLNALPVESDKDMVKMILQTIQKYPATGKVYLNGPLYMRAEANEKISFDFMVLLPVGILFMIIFLFFSFRQKRAVILPLSVVALAILISLALISVFNWQLSIIGILIPVMMIAIANDYGIHYITKYQELSNSYPELPEKTIVEKTTKYLKKPVILTGLTTMAGLMGLMLHIMLPAKQMGLISTIGIGAALLLSLTLIPSVLTLFNKSNRKNIYLTQKQNIINSLLLFSAKIIHSSPKRIIYFFILFLMISGAGLISFGVASDFDDILHKNHPYSKALKLANDELGGTKNISVLFQGDIRDPKILKKLNDYENELERMPEISSVTSLATMIREMSKALYESTDSEYDAIPEQRNTVSQFLELYNMSGDPADLEYFTDFDFKYALMEIQFRSENKKTISLIEERINALTKDDPNFSLTGGYCLVEKQLSDAIALGQAYSLAFALLLIITMLAIIFKSLAAGLIGGLPLLFSIISTFGIMGWMGVQLNIVTALLSSVSIGLGVEYTIHILWRIKKEIRLGKPLKTSIQKSIRTSGYGITINALSVIIGFSVLLFSSFGIIRSFGFLIMLSITICLICSMILIPAICLLFKPKFLFK